MLTQSPHEWLFRFQHVNNVLLIRLYLNWAQKLVVHITPPELKFDSFHSCTLSTAYWTQWGEQGDSMSYILLWPYACALTHTLLCRQTSGHEDTPLTSVLIMTPPCHVKIEPATLCAFRINARLIVVGLVHHVAILVHPLSEDVQVWGKVLIGVHMQPAHDVVDQSNNPLTKSITSQTPYTLNG